MNDIWNALVNRLHSKDSTKEQKIDAFLYLTDMEHTIGPEEVDKLIVKRRKNNNEDDSFL